MDEVKITTDTEATTKRHKNHKNIFVYFVPFCG